MTFPKWRPRSWTPRAFTLIETLAVIVLLALIGTMIGTGLVHADDSGRFSATVAMIRDTDGLARMHARTAGRAVVMRLLSDPARLQLAQYEDEPLAERAVPKRIQVQISANNIVFDRSGRSIDYIVEISAGELRRRLEIRGLTGWITELREVE